MSFSEIDITDYTIKGGAFRSSDGKILNARLKLFKRDKSQINKLILHHSAGWGAGEAMINSWQTQEYEGQLGIIHTQWQGLYVPNKGGQTYTIGGKTLENGNYFIKNYDPDNYYGAHSTTGGDANSIGIEVISPGWTQPGLPGGTITRQKMIDDGFNSNGCNAIGKDKIMFEYPPSFSYALGQWCHAQCIKYGIPKVLLCDYNALTKEWITANNLEDFKAKINFNNLSAPFSQFKGITYHFHTDNQGKLDITPSIFYGESGISFFKGFNNGGFGGSSANNMSMFEIDVTSGKTYSFYFESDYFLKRDSLTQTLMSPIYSNPLTSNEKIYNDKIKEIVKQIVYSKFDKIYNLDPNEMSLVPLEFTMTIDGISGLSIGDVIECEFLPEVYQRNTIILITGVENDITGNDWKTNLKISVKAILKKEEKNKK